MSFRHLLSGVASYEKFFPFISNLCCCIKSYSNNTCLLLDKPHYQTKLTLPNNLNVISMACNEEKIDLGVTLCYP
jgi:hypothetical protein